MKNKKLFSSLAKYLPSRGDNFQDCTFNNEKKNHDMQYIDLTVEQ